MGDTFKALLDDDGQLWIRDGELKFSLDVRSDRDREWFSNLIRSRDVYEIKLEGRFAHETKTLVALAARDFILRSFDSAWKGVDLGEILAHPLQMREKVESIQRASEQDRKHLALEFLRRASGLEDGDAGDTLRRFYVQEFRLQRAKDIEDELIRKSDEQDLQQISADLSSIDLDAATWASWMLSAHPILQNKV